MFEITAGKHTHQYDSYQEAGENLIHAIRFYNDCSIRPVLTVTKHQVSVTVTPVPFGWEIHRDGVLLLHTENDRLPAVLHLVAQIHGDR